MYDIYDIDWEVGSHRTRQLSNAKDQDVPGLVNEGFRYRDLETGSFLTRDPLGFVDGPNECTYVMQNPWTRFDPLGLKYEKIDDKDDKSNREYRESYNSKLDQAKDVHNEVRKSNYYKGSAVESIDKDSKNVVIVKVADSANDGGHYFEETKNLR